MIIKTDKAKRKQLSIRQRRHVRRMRPATPKVVIPDDQKKNGMRTSQMDTE